MTVSSSGAMSRTAVATAASTGSVTTTRASQSSTRKAISGGVSRKFTGTAIAPSRLAARIDSTNSVRLSIRIITRSPNCTPRRFSASASAVTRRSSSRPRGGVAEVPQRRRVRLHQRVPGQLVGPVLPARQVRLLGGRLIGHGLCAELCGQRSSPLCFAVRQTCADLTFDQTLCCPGHSKAWFGPQVSETSPTHRLPEEHVNAPVEVRRRQVGGLRRAQLSDEVAAHLRAAIMSGTLRPGTFIRLDDTAAQLGVSITPVREALLTLRGEGMVQLEPHRGHVVRSAEPPGHRGHLLAAGHHRQGAGCRRGRDTSPTTRSTSSSDLNDALAAAVAAGDTERIVTAEFAFHRALQPGGRPDQAGVVPATRRALHAAADLRRRCGLGRRRRSITTAGSSPHCAPATSAPSPN